MERDDLLKAKMIYKVLPPRFGPEDLEKALGMGLIPKKDLEDGASYRGWCRNATLATWDKAREVFVYKRTKFTATFEEDIKHPEDDEGFDVFVPIAKEAPTHTSAPKSP